LKFSFLQLQTHSMLSCFSLLPLLQLKRGADLKFFQNYPKNFKHRRIDRF
jgi:hypothetical protein